MTRRTLAQISLALTVIFGAAAGLDYTHQAAGGRFGAGLSLLIDFLSLGLSLTVISTVLRRQIAAPLMRFVEASDRLTQGNVAGHLDSIRPDELGRLGTSFNAMAGAIADRDIELAAQMADLEHQVEARTTDLQVALDRMQAALDEAEASNDALLASREQLEQSEARKSAILDAVPDAVVTLDAEGRILEWNPAAQTIFGHTRAAVLGLDAMELFVPPEEHEAHRSGRLASLRGQGAEAGGAWAGERIETLRIRADGSRFPVELTVTRMPGMGDPTFTAFFHDISLRKRHEEERRVVEQTVKDVRDRLQAVINNLPGIVYSVDHEGRFTLSEGQGLKALGLEPGQVVGLSAFELYCDAPEVEKTLRKALNGEAQTWTTQVADHFYENRCTPLSDAEGRITEAFTLALDVTERRAAEQALRESEERLKMALQAGGMGTWDTDLTTGRVQLSEGLEHLFGLSRGIREASFTEFLTRVHPEDQARVARIQAESVETGDQYDAEFRVLDSEGAARWIVTKGRFFHDDAGRPVRMTGAIVDITERKEAEQDLVRMIAQNTQLLSAITSVLVAVDETGCVLAWNGAAEAALGLSKGDVLDQPFADLPIAWNWEYVLDGVSLCKMGHQTVRVDDVHVTGKDGKERLLGVSLSPLDSEAGDLGFLLLAADITERRNLEGQLAHAQKMESIGQLAAGIAHEINTPVQYVGDNIRFLQQCFEDLIPVWDAFGQLVEAGLAGNVTPEMARQAQTAAEQADLEYLRAEAPQASAQTLEGIGRVSQIVKAMKEFSHPGGADKTPIDLNRALESTLTVARNEWKYVAELETDFQSDLPPVPCLPGDLNQVFLNIIVNAAHAIAGVVGDGDGRGIIRVSTRADAGWVEVRISDTGTGIPEAIRAKIFDPFFTTKEVGKGTGQGLAISHAVVVDKHGGAIRVESEVGQGTTFIVRLPLGTAASAWEGEEWAEAA